MSGKGKALELAISRAATRYRQEGRAMLIRQQPPIASVNGAVQYVGKAPVDFLGGLAGGQGLAVEAKSTEEKKSFELRHLRDEQRANLSALYALGQRVLLVVAFDSEGETFAIDWAHIASFLAKPWRESLSVAWCRAFGLVVPEIDRENPKTRRCLFLDGKEHPQARISNEIVNAEKRRSPSVEPEELDLFADDSPSTGSRYEGLTMEQRKDRILAAAQDGMKRQLKDGARRMVWRGGRKR